MCEAHIQDAPDDISQSDSDVVTPEQKKSKKEKTKKKTNRKSPRKLMKSFRGESIYKEKSSQTLHEIPHHQLLHPTGIERVLLRLVS